MMQQGKGGVIKRMTEFLDPRSFHVWSIAAPEQDEKKLLIIYNGFGGKYLCMGRSLFLIVLGMDVCLWKE